jgi:hypothetical protein
MSGNYLVSHTLALMLGPAGVEHYFRVLFRNAAPSLKQHVLCYQNMIIAPTTRFEAPPSARKFRSGDGVVYWILDYIPDSRFGAIVPQQIYVPSARSRSIPPTESLLPPIFFVQNNGSVGIPMVYAAAKMTNSLLDDLAPVNMRGKTTTKLVLTVSRLCAHALKALTRAFRFPVAGL